MDAITAQGVMWEITTIHSSIQYSKDIGHPSHAQTSTRRNKHR